jgi:hypothetical protein
VAALDFTTALGRLLSDGILRDRFATHPEVVVDEMDVAAGERSAICALAPNELEVQADILLRKRFAQVRPLLPEVCLELGERAWPEFREYARCRWTEVPWCDAAGYGGRLVACGLMPRGLREISRAEFAASRVPIHVYLVRDLPVGGKIRRGILVFVRTGNGRWKEFAAHGGL